MTANGPEKIIKGPDGLQLPWDVSLGRLFYEILSNYDKNRIFLVDAHTNIQQTFSQLLNDSTVLAEILKEFGYGRDTVLAISSENNLDFYIPVMSSLFIGSALAPINPIYTITELGHVLNISKPLMVFCSSMVVEKFLEMKKNFKFIKEIVLIDCERVVEGTLNLRQLLKEKRQRGCLRNFKPLDGKPQDLKAFILSSSGTTGLPKGVLLSHHNFGVSLLMNTDPRYPKTSPNDTLLGIMPFFHAFGLNIGLLAIFGGQKLICFKRFVDDLFLKAIQDHRINILWIAPPLAIFLTKSPKVAKYDLSSVEKIASGGAPMKKSVEMELKKKFKIDFISQAYGMTETTLSVTRRPNEGFKEGSSGKLNPFVSCKIVDPETGKSLGANEVGEIWIKGPNVMVGYYNNEEATKKVFSPDGWLKTGDLGYYDEDEFFFIVDRLKELIKYKGFQVAPAELEALLLTHSKIRDAGVVGLPDEESGELPFAFVVAENLTEKEVQDYVKGKLSPQKWLRGGGRFIQEIPKNPSGKILRKELRKLLKTTKSKL